jgi:hypothetical protein
MSQEEHPTPVAALARGLIASAVGTLAMDVLLYARHRQQGGSERFVHWELSAGVQHWDDAPAPALVGKRLVEGLFQRKIPDRRAALVNNVTHWATGLAGGAQFGLLAGSLKRVRVGYGLVFGAAVWATGYAVLPAAGLYKPIWEYDAETLASDLSAHLVYGLVTASTFKYLHRAAR